MLHLRVGGGYANAGQELRGGKLSEWGCSGEERECLKTYFKTCRLGDWALIKHKRQGKELARKTGCMMFYFKALFHSIYQ